MIAKRRGGLRRWRWRPTSIHKGLIESLHLLQRRGTRVDPQDEARVRSEACPHLLEVTAQHGIVRTLGICQIVEQDRRASWNWIQDALGTERRHVRRMQQLFQKEHGILLLGRNNQECCRWLIQTLMLGPLQRAHQRATPLLEPGCWHSLRLLGIFRGARLDHPRGHLLSLSGARLRSEVRIHKTKTGVREMDGLVETMVRHRHLAIPAAEWRKEFRDGHCICLLHTPLHSLSGDDSDNRLKHLLMQPLPVPLRVQHHAQKGAGQNG
mmetsp:Transcript_34771/g.92844  ORF Transcript_34771/g.92844 Transcript_34771/m.92844 type:complete len:267 (-) Transcript_34771:7-807(-)